MVASLGAVLTAIRRRTAPELAAPDHQRRVQQPSGFQIHQQTGHRLVGLGRLRLMVLVARDVAVPVGGVHTVARPNLHKTDAALDQPAREQAAPAEIRAHRIIQAVQLLRRVRFAADVGGFRRRHLHAERELVRRNPGGQLRVMISRIEMLLVHLAQRVEKIALFLRLHARRTAEIENLIPARPE